MQTNKGIHMKVSDGKPVSWQKSLSNRLLTEGSQGFIVATGKEPVSGIVHN